MGRVDLPPGTRPPLINPSSITAVQLFILLATESGVPSGDEAIAESWPN